MDNRKISLCLTNYNRVELLFQSFAQVIDDDRISEIVISDDCSDLPIFDQIKGIVSALNPIHNNKIKLHRNEVNLDCYRNKQHSISLASNDWCIIFDSDNILNKSYIDRLYEMDEWESNTSYMPSKANPTFIYTEFEGQTISKENVASFMGLRLFDTMLNCFNLFINRDEYLKVFDDSINPHTADSIYFNYCWFLAGNYMYVVGGMEYYHTIHSGHYVQNNHLTGNLYAEIEEKIKQLK